MSTEGTALALQGIKVVEIANFMSGPLTGLLLADFGADVIKIEKPRGGDDGRVMPPFIDGEGVFYVQFCRNKQSVAVDLKHPRGRDLVADLISQADVMIDNFRPGTLRDLGLDYETMRDRNTRLIACSITGFGEGNAYSDRAAYDPILQAMSGLMLNTGFEGDPPTRAGAPVMDLVSALTATIGILVAIHDRTRTGTGQKVDASLLGAAAAIMGTDIFSYWATGAVHKRLSHEQPMISLIPILRSADGRFVQIALGNHGIFRRVCAAGGRAELAEEERFATIRAISEHGAELQVALQELFASHDYDFWSRALTEHEVPWGPVNNVAEFYDDQVVRELFVDSVQRRTGNRVPVLRTTPTLSSVSLAVPLAPDGLGEHTEQVLRERLGLPVEEIDLLRKSGAIA